MAQVFVHFAFALGHRHPDLVRFVVVLDRLHLRGEVVVFVAGVVDGFHVADDFRHFARADQVDASPPLDAEFARTFVEQLFHEVGLVVGRIHGVERRFVQFAVRIGAGAFAHLLDQFARKGFVARLVKRFGVQQNDVGEAEHREVDVACPRRNAL